MITSLSGHKLVTWSFWFDVSRIWKKIIKRLEHYNYLFSRILFVLFINLACLLCVKEKQISKFSQSSMDFQAFLLIFICYIICSKYEIFALSYSYTFYETFFGTHVLRRVNSYVSNFNCGCWFQASLKHISSWILFGIY